MHVDVPERELIAAQRELDPPGFTGPQSDTLESLQLPDGASDTRAALADVKLNDFLARTVPGVFHLGRNAQRGTVLGVERAGADPGGAERDGRIREPRVRQTVAEGEQGRIQLIDIARVVALGGVPGRMRQVEAFGRAAGVERVVVQRFLANGAREADRQPPARSRIPEERANDRRPRLDAREPHLEQRRHVGER